MLICWHSSQTCHLHQCKGNKSRLVSEADELELFLPTYAYRTVFQRVEHDQTKPAIDQASRGAGWVTVDRWNLSLSS